MRIYTEVCIKHQNQVGLEKYARLSCVIAWWRAERMNVPPIAEVPEDCPFYLEHFAMGELSDMRRKER